MRTLRSIVGVGKRVRFLFYRSGELHYQTDCGLRFAVPIADMGDATCLAEERAILFMRYIRKQLEAIEQEQLRVVSADLSNREAH